MPRGKRKVDPQEAAPAEVDFKARAASRWPKMKAWQREFLELWRTEHDRQTALAAVAKKVSDLDSALDSDEKFFDAYGEVQREITVSLEDAQIKSAMTGKNAGAQKLALETFSDHYRKKPNAAKRGGAQSSGKVSGVKDWSARSEKRWGAIFASTRSAGHLLEAGNAPAVNPQ